MLRPFIVAQALTALDHESAIARLNRQPQAACMVAVEDHRRQDFQRFHHRRSAPPGPAGGQRHFGIGRAWEHDGAPHPMIGQPGQHLDIQRILPGRLGTGQTPAQQRVFTGPLNGAQALVGLGMPVPLALPGIIRQPDARGGRLETGLQQGWIGQEQAPPASVPDRAHAIVLAAQYAKHPALDRE